METKKCPFCAEEIRIEAIKCKHCGEFLETETQSVSDGVWICKKCKKEVEDNNDICWNCGTYREGIIELRSDKKVSKINPFWILGIVIIITFLASQWFALGAGPVETNWKDVKTTMIANNDVEKIIVVNEKEAHVYLKKSSYDKYAAKLNNGFTAPTKAGPHYFFTIGSVDSFEKNLQELQTNASEENKISVEYKTVHNYLGELLNWIWPFAIIILICLFIFKRMSKGSGIGEAGSIFNESKSHSEFGNEQSKFGQTVIVNQVENKSNGIGTGGFVLAVIAIFIGWIPVLGWIVWLLVLIFSFVGLFKSPRGFAIVGLVISIIGIILLIAVFGTIGAALLS